MTINKSLAIAALIASTSWSAFAQDHAFSTTITNFDLKHLRLSSGISTFGYTFTADYRLNKNWGVRGIFGYAPVTAKVIKDGQQIRAHVMNVAIVTDFPINTYKLDVTGNIGGYGILIDHYPNDPLMGPGFRMSGGILSSTHKLSSSGIVNEAITGFRTGETVDLYSLEAEMTGPGISPYFGLGFDYQPHENFGFMFDAGVMANVSYDGFLRGVASDPAEQDYVDDVLDREMKLKLEELDKFPLLPYLGITFSYRF